MPMKKILLLIIILISSSGCSRNSNSTPLSFSAEDFDIEVYSEVYLHDLVKSTNGEIVSKNILIDTTSIGKHKYPMDIVLDGTTYTKHIEMNIVDTTPPLIIAGESVSVPLDYEGNITDLLMFGDNYDRNPSCMIEGDYDFNSVGSYDIKYIVTDSSNNIQSQSLTLHVSDINPPSDPKGIAFSDIVNTYKTPDTEIGIDVSKWQEDIDFTKVKEAGASFVMIRMAFQKESNGEISLDPYYIQNIQKAKAAGLQVGIYLYSTATSVKEAVEQAEWVIHSLDNEVLDLPIVFDWESWSDFSKMHINLYDINQIAKAFINTIEDNGYTGMLYSSKTYLEYIWETSDFDSIWLANYTEQTEYQGDYQIWQLTNIGRIDGIKGNVDINILYK
jgi:GH25 family lysozyme M1 (1,4-beta-N-acetylmuramidase)